MRRLFWPARHVAALLWLCASCAPALADVTVLVVAEPTARKDGLMVSRGALEAGLAKAIGQGVSVSSSDDLTAAMRDTRSGGFDVFIAPAQVAASAIAHGYELVGSTDPEEQYLLVGKADVSGVDAMRRHRIYLPQQDSIYTYLARGMLTAGGLSFKDLGKVEYARYPQAGLTAISLKMTEATVIRRDEWEQWQKDNPGAARVLSTAGNVPGGLSVVVKKSLAPELRAQTAKWFATSARSCGLKPVVQRTELVHYKTVAELGTFTPTSLPGATVVGADEVRRLMAQGAVLVDTRTEKEFRQKHIPGALFVPYHEKSLKDVAYDAKLDDFSGLKTLNSGAATIFHCNGAECWKSYKASRAAQAAGFGKVYWYRGGMPDWEASGQQVASLP